jgi:hypothetical protein
VFICSPKKIVDGKGSRLARIQMHSGHQKAEKAIYFSQRLQNSDFSNVSQRPLSINVRIIAPVFSSVINVSKPEHEKILFYPDCLASFYG